MDTDKPRYTITVDEELLQQIEDFRYNNRIATRAEATIEIIRIGLETLSQDEHQDMATIVAAHMESEYGVHDSKMIEGVIRVLNLSTRRKRYAKYTGRWDGNSANQ